MKIFYDVTIEVKDRNTANRWYRMFDYVQDYIGSGVEMEMMRPGYYSFTVDPREHRPDDRSELETILNNMRDCGYINSYHIDERKSRR